MIKSLKSKFVFSAFIIMTIVIAIIFATVNYFMYSQTIKRSEQLLNFIVNNENSTKPIENKKRFEDNKLFRIMPTFHDYKDNVGTFVAILDDNYNVLEYKTKSPTSYTEEEKSEIINNIVKENSNKGIYNNFYFLLITTDNQTTIAVTNISQQQAMLKQLLLISILIYLVSICVVIIISLFLSNWVVRPAKQALEKQKQFIADASHELKTPLTIIKSNTDLLESESGKNKWLGYIQSETTRMSELINDMLYLAKYDDNKIDIQKFDLSNAVTQAALPFESIAFEKEIEFNLNIHSNIKFTGDKKAIKQLIMILLDNALKSTQKNGKVEITLTAEKKAILIKVSNTGSPIPKECLDNIFDRFYRNDSSRSRENGGFGLGLAIANSIVIASKGNINVKSENGINSFLVKL